MTLWDQTIAQLVLQLADKARNMFQLIKSKPIKIVLILVSLVVLVLLYGIVSWKVFERETLLSNPIDCMPNANPEDDIQPTDYGISRREKLFGSRCDTF